MERSSTVQAGKTTVTVSLSRSNKMSNIYRNSAATNTVDDSAEISIFDAEKYFNELNVLEAPKPPAVLHNRVSPAESEPPRFSSTSSSIDGYSNFYRNHRTRSFRSAATPTASSEASWNSQTGLLSVPPGSMSVSLQKARRSLSPPPTPSTFRWLSLRKKCPCSCNKSVQIKDKSLRRPPENILPPPPPPQQQQSHMIVRAASTSSKISSSSGDKVRHDSFQESWYRNRRSLSNSRETRSFSTDNSKNNSDLITPQIQALAIRTSFTAATNANTSAFSFPILNGNSAIKPKPPQDPNRDSLEIFKPSHDRTNSGFPGSPNSRMRSAPDAIDDGASDASSDLFEIESFASATTAPMSRVVGPQAMFLYSRRESLEEPTTECCYEPSEASIDWSVTTAEGFDRASVAYASEADFGEFSEPRPEKGRRKSASGLLMSCRCEKAVSVGNPGPRRPAVGPASYGRAAAGTNSNSTLAMWAVSHKV